MPLASCAFSASLILHCQDKQVSALLQSLNSQSLSPVDCNNIAISSIDTCIATNSACRLCSQVDLVRVQGFKGRRHVSLTGTYTLFGQESACASAADLLSITTHELCKNCKG